ncbi:NAC transcription factor 56-like protein [Tanacetum coccineum]
MENGEDFRHLPPGFRFHPSDEELINDYLLKKVTMKLIPASVIGEIELYNFDPWDLPRKALFGKDEWFFFSPRDRKYPNGSRPNRSAGSGYWKATGKDKPIFASSGLRKIGVKKALAFFTGIPTQSIKTNWTMSEYRLPESSSRSPRQNGSMRLDDWVLCRITQKGNNSKNKQIEENPKNKVTQSQFPIIPPELPSSYMITKTNMDIISDRRFKEFQLMASILAAQDLPSMMETCSPKQIQDASSSLLFKNGVIEDENNPFLLNEDNIRYEDIYPIDMFTSDDSYEDIDTDNLDTIMFKQL